MPIPRRTSVERKVSFHSWNSLIVTKWLVDNHQYALGKTFFENQIDGEDLVKLENQEYWYRFAKELNLETTQIFMFSFMLVQLCRGHYQITQPTAPKIDRLNLGLWKIPKIKLKAVPETTPSKQIKPHVADSPLDIEEIGGSRFSSLSTGSPRLDLTPVTHASDSLSRMKEVIDARKKLGNKDAQSESLIKLNKTLRSKKLPKLNTAPLPSVTLSNMNTFESGSNVETLKIENPPLSSSIRSYSDVMGIVLEFLDEFDTLVMVISHPTDAMIRKANYEGILLGYDDVQESMSAVAFLNSGGTMEFGIFWEGDDGIYATAEGDLSSVRIYSNGSDFSIIRSCVGSMRYSHPAIAECRSFVGLKEDGIVMSWGQKRFGAESYHLSKELVDVKQIFHTRMAWAALRNDFSVVVWGDSKYGGDKAKVAESLCKNVKNIYATSAAFAALKEDGSVVTWGSPTDGGDCSFVSYRLSNQVTDIYSTDHAFAALKDDGTIVCWGHKNFGGSVPEHEFIYDVLKVASTRGAFAALCKDGSVISWGRSDVGGGFHVHSDPCSETTTFIDLRSFGTGFEAIRKDGTILTLDSYTHGME